MFFVEYFQHITDTIIMYLQSRIFTLICYLDKIATQKPSVNCHIIPINIQIACHQQLTNMHITNNLKIILRIVCVNPDIASFDNHNSNSFVIKYFKCIATTIILDLQSRVLALIPYLDKIATQKSSINCHIIPINI